MREKSDLSKILEGRCRGKGIDYVGFKKANESHSRGTATQIYDPVEQRIVDTLSMGEMMFFWFLRFDENVLEIKEQFCLDPRLVGKIAVSLGFPIPKRILSTDLLARYADGTIVAYSIKYKRSVLDRESYKKESAWESMIRRSTIEKKYWEFLGVRFVMVFTEEMNRKKAMNIQTVMSCYDPLFVSTLDQKYQYLIAHHHVQVDMDSDYIPFAKIAEENKEEIEKLYAQKRIEG